MLQFNIVSYHHVIIVMSRGVYFIIINIIIVSYSNKYCPFKFGSYPIGWPQRPGKHCVTSGLVSSLSSVVCSQNTVVNHAVGLRPSC